MEILNYIHAHIVKISYFYTIIFIGFVLWVLISITNTVEVSNTSQIPSYSIEKIEHVYREVNKRKKLDVQTPSKLSPGDFGKDEPFR